MKRREALKSSLILAGALSTGTMTAVLSGCKTDTSPSWQPAFLSIEQEALVAEVAERILPKTDTPGAKDVFASRFIDNAVHKLLTKKEQTNFIQGLKVIDEEAVTQFDKKFTDLSSEDMDKVLTTLVKDSKEDDEHIFPIMQQLTKSAYFTSELICTEHLVYQPIPGPFKGCVSVQEVGGQLYNY